MIQRICSGIPYARILDYFELWATKDSSYIEKSYDNASGSVLYRFEAYTITIVSNLNPPIIRPVVPMTDVTFAGDSECVDVAVQTYRMAFLSAGG